VDRGLERRGNDKIAWVGMDEKSFRANNTPTHREYVDF